MPVPSANRCVRSSTSHDTSWPGSAPPSCTTNPRRIARPAAGIFFPQRPLLKLGTHGYTPAALHKIVQAAGQVKSHAVAAQILEGVGEITISSRHVNRLTEEIGTELAAKRDRQTDDYVHHRRTEPSTPAPLVAAVALDGGRVLTRASGQGPGVHGEHWKEDKVACLLSLEGETVAEDPHPQPPRCFLDAPAVDQLVREIQANHGRRAENELPQLAELRLGKETAAAPPGPVETAADPPQDHVWPPQRTKAPRTCVATMGDCHEFGKMAAAEAHQRNFQAAPRRALLGDGSAWIWNQQEKWFRDWTPIVDFTHALTYLYVTATVLASSVSERWDWYVVWMTRLWQGRVGEVIAELEGRLQRLEPIPAESRLPPTDPREALRRTLTYLTNNASRMNYAEYRKLGLPVSSSMVESLIKEINYRVKGTEKFWDNPEGAEAILQVRAALLSDDDRLASHMANRPGSPFRRHKTRKSAQAA